MGVGIKEKAEASSAHILLDRHPASKYQAYGRGEEPERIQSASQKTLLVRSSHATLPARSHLRRLLSVATVKSASIPDTEDLNHGKS